MVQKKQSETKKRYLDNHNDNTNPFEGIEKHKGSAMTNVADKEDLLEERNSYVHNSSKRHKEIELNRQPNYLNINNTYYNRREARRDNRNLYQNNSNHTENLKESRMRKERTSDSKEDRSRPRKEDHNKDSYKNKRLSDHEQNIQLKKYFSGCNSRGNSYDIMRKLSCTHNHLNIYRNATDNVKRNNFITNTAINSQ